MVEKALIEEIEKIISNRLMYIQRIEKRVEYGRINKEVAERVIFRNRAIKDGMSMILSVLK